MLNSSLLQVSDVLLYMPANFMLIYGTWYSLKIVFMVLKSTLADPLYLYKETNSVTQVKSLEKEQLKIQGYKKIFTVWKAKP